MSGLRVGALGITSGADKVRPFSTHEACCDLVFGIAPDNLTTVSASESSTAVYLSPLDPTPDDIDQCRNLLLRWRWRLSRRVFEVLERHLSAILNRDELAGIIPNAASFEALLGYLSRHPEFKPPSLGIRQDGRFAVSWRLQSRARLNIEFLDYNNVRVICVDARPGQLTPLKGTFELPARRLDAFLSGAGCDNWMI